MRSSGAGPAPHRQLTETALSLANHTVSQISHCLHAVKRRELSKRVRECVGACVSEFVAECESQRYAVSDQDTSASRVLVEVQVTMQAQLLGDTGTGIMVVHLVARALCLGCGGTHPPNP